VEIMMDIVQYQREERIGYITLNRPEKLNAFSDEMSVALFNALYQFYDDEEAWIGIIAGNGRAFCSGADVKQRQLRPQEEMKKLGGPAGREGNIRQPFFRPPVGKPIIAAMHGYVYGAGLRIALYCDLTVAAKGTKFQVTEVARGIDGIPFWMMLSERGGGVFADDVCITGRVWDAEEAYRQNMLNRLAEPGEHLAEAKKLAQSVLANPPLAVRAVVEARRGSLEAIDRHAYSVRPRTLHFSEDFRESARAFVEKRKPVYHGR
jgi:enoyl-CoA hydratase/carnithine racemase